MLAKSLRLLLTSSLLVFKLVKLLSTSVLVSGAPLVARRVSVVLMTHLPIRTLSG